MSQDLSLNIIKIFAISNKNSPEITWKPSQFFQITPGKQILQQLSTSYLLKGEEFQYKVRQLKLFNMLPKHSLLDLQSSIAFVYLAL